MKNFHVGDNIFFLLQEEPGKDLWNAGAAVIKNIEDKEGFFKKNLKAEDVKYLFFESASYPFEGHIKVENVLRNWSEEKRNQFKIVGKE